MTIKSAMATIQRDLKYFGTACTIYDIFLRVLNWFVFLKVLRVIAISEIPTKPALPPNFRFEHIPVGEVARLSQNPEYALHPRLLHEMARGNNTCFGIYDGRTLANYMFVFVTPALMTDELEVAFGPRYAYLCAAFTHPRYRGLHVNSLGVDLGVREYLTRGFREILAYVESNNFSSLKSFARCGWRTVGTVHILRLFGRYIIHNGRGCSAYAFRVLPITTGLYVESASRGANSN